MALQWGVEFSPDSRMIVSGPRSGSIILWDVITGRKLQLFSSHTSAVHRVLFFVRSNLRISAIVRGWSMASPPLLATKYTWYAHWRAFE